jgi:hypothetical protein
VRSRAEEPRVRAQSEPRLAHPENHSAGLRSLRVTEPPYHPAVARARNACESCSWPHVPVPRQYTPDRLARALPEPLRRQPTQGTLCGVGTIRMKKMRERHEGNEGSYGVSGVAHSERSTPSTSSDARYPLISAHSRRPTRKRPRSSARSDSITSQWEARPSLSSRSPIANGGRL